MLTSLYLAVWDLSYTAEPTVSIYGRFSVYMPYKILHHMWLSCGDFEANSSVCISQTNWPCMREEFMLGMLYEFVHVQCMQGREGLVLAGRGSYWDQRGVSQTSTTLCNTSWTDCWQQLRWGMLFHCASQQGFWLKSRSLFSGCYHLSSYFVLTVVLMALLSMGSSLCDKFQNKISSYMYFFFLEIYFVLNQYCKQKVLVLKLDFWGFYFRLIVP